MLELYHKVRHIGFLVTMVLFAIALTVEVYLKMRPKLIRLWQRFTNAPSTNLD
jgi:hypothetical protein